MQCLPLLMMALSPKNRKLLHRHLRVCTDGWIVSWADQRELHGDDSGDPDGQNSWQNPAAMVFTQRWWSTEESIAAQTRSQCPLCSQGKGRQTRSLAPQESKPIAFICLLSQHPLFLTSHLVGVVWSAIRNSASLHRGYRSQDPLLADEKGCALQTGSDIAVPMLDTRGKKAHLMSHWKVSVECTDDMISTWLHPPPAWNPWSPKR